MLIKYLLDELWNYEQDHSDALCPIAIDQSQSHAGEASEQRPLTVAEGRVLFAAQTAQLTAAISRIHLPSPPPSNIHAKSSSSALVRQQTTNSSSPLAPLRTCIFPHIPTSPLAPATLPVPTGPLCVVPNISRADGWKQAVKDWEEADLSRSLPVPLSQWTEQEKRDSKNQHSKWCQRQLVATEFIEEYVLIALLPSSSLILERYHRDETVFQAAYGTAIKQGFTALVNAIRASRQRKGTLKKRHRK